MVKINSKWTKHLFVIGSLILTYIADLLGNGNLALNLSIAILPVLLLGLFIYTLDEYPEPLGQILKVFILGSLSAPAVLLLHAILELLGIQLEGTPLKDAFLSASLVEEGVKLLFFLIIVWNMKAFDEPFDAVVYACLISLGFALIENILYVIEGGLSVSILRAFLAVPSHFLDGIFMGYFLAKAKFKNKLYLVMAFIAPFIAHGLYDFILMYSEQLSSELLCFILMIGFLYFVYFTWYLSLKLLKKLEIDNTDYHLSNADTEAGTEE